MQRHSLSMVFNLFAESIVSRVNLRIDIRIHGGASTHELSFESRFTGIPFTENRLHQTSRTLDLPALALYGLLAGTVTRKNTSRSGYTASFDDVILTPQQKILKMFQNPGGWLQFQHTC